MSRAKKRANSLDVFTVRYSKTFDDWVLYYPVDIDQTFDSRDECLEHIHRMKQAIILFDDVEE